MICSMPLKDDDGYDESNDESHLNFNTKPLAECCQPDWPSKTASQP